MQDKIICDNCSFMWSPKETMLKDKKIKINDEVLTFTYFRCPKCKTTYEVALKNQRYYELIKDLVKTEDLIRANFNTGNKFKAESLRGDLIRINRLLDDNNRRLRAKYPGRFIVKNYGVIYEE